MRGCGVEKQLSFDQIPAREDPQCKIPFLTTRGENGELILKLAIQRG